MEQGLKETELVSDGLKKQVAQIFSEIWKPLGETHRAKADALGLSISSVSDKIHGRHTPDRHTRALMCCLVQALRELPDDDSREELVKRGLQLMRELEAEGDDE